MMHGRYPRDDGMGNKKDVDGQDNPGPDALNLRSEVLRVPRLRGAGERLDSAL
jgi:hypothetical protein